MLPAATRYVIFLTSSQIWGRSGVRDFCQQLRGEELSFSPDSSLQGVYGFRANLNRDGLEVVFLFALLATTRKVCAALPEQADPIFAAYCKEEKDLAFFFKEARDLTGPYELAIFTPKQVEWPEKSPLLKNKQPLFIEQTGAIGFSTAWKLVLKYLLRSKQSELQTAEIAEPLEDESLRSVHSSLSLGENFMSTVTESLNTLMMIDGATAAALGDATSGMMLGGVGTGLNLDVAVAGNTEVVRSKLKTMEALGLRDSIEDILITLGMQYHIIRPIKNKPGLFIYIVLDKSKANLAMARYKVLEVEGNISV